MSNYILPIKRLSFLEKELGNLLKANRKSWVKVAKVLMTIEKEGLYVIKHNSFTQYILAISADYKVNPSTFWRAKSSLTTYMDIAEITNHESLIPQNIKATPEQLELYKRVESIVPERILRELKSRMLKGENVRKELRHIWQIYKPLKKGKTERGRKPLVLLESKKEIQQLTPSISIEEEDSIKDSYKLEAFNISEQEIERANIINALRTKKWIKDTLDINEFKYSFLTNIRLTGEASNDYDILIPVSYTNELQLTTNFIGVNIVANDKDFEGLKKRVSQTKFCQVNYMVFSEKYFQEEVLSLIPENIGVIVTQKYTDHTKLEGKVVRFATHITVSPQNLLYTYQTVLHQTLQWNK